MDDTISTDLISFYGSSSFNLDEQKRIGEELREYLISKILEDLITSTDLKQKLKFIDQLSEWVEQGDTLVVNELKRLVSQENSISVKTNLQVLIDIIS